LKLHFSSHTTQFSAARISSVTLPTFSPFRYIFKSPSSTKRVPTFQKLNTTLRVLRFSDLRNLISGGWQLHAVRMATAVVRKGMAWAIWLRHLAWCNKNM